MAGSKYIIPIVFKSDRKGINDAEDGLTKLGNFAEKAGLAIAAGLAVAATAAVAFGAESLKAAAEAEAITRGLENAAKNAGVFGDSATSIGKATAALDAHSKKLGEMSGIDDEIINQIKTGWLAVPDLAAMGTDGINKLAEVTADVAAGTGKDITAIGMAFTRVAGDTENAFSKLTRAGIVFTDEQKATFDSILQTNGEIAAQQYLVDQLAAKYSGAAEAAANPFERLDVIFGNLKETIGVSLLPAFEQVIPVLQSFIENLTSDPEFQAFLDTMSQTLANMLPRLQPVLENFGDLMIRLLPGLIPLMETFGSLVNIVSTAMGGAASNSGKLWKELQLLADTISLINDLFTWADESISKVKTTLGSGWSPFINAIVDSLNPLYTMIRNIVAAIQALTGNKIAALNTLGVNTSSLTNIGERARGVKFATGGIVTKPIYNATVGEAGPEAIIPLDRFKQVTGIGGNSGGATYNISVNAGMGTDGAALGEQIVNAIRRYERTSGAVFARA